MSSSVANMISFNAEKKLHINFLATYLEKKMINCDTSMCMGRYQC
jgi:hypothetical protein